MSKIIIAPSILACDFLNIETDLSYLKDAEDLWLHLDIMDGHFVPNLTFGAPIVKMISQKFDYTLDAHLMVSNPEFHIELLKDHGVHNFTFHYEASQDNCLELIAMAKKNFKSVGISIKPGTEVTDVPLEVYKEIDLLLVMSVEPGFGGQSFIENTYNKLNQIKKIKDDHDLNFMVQIDGGVKDINAAKLIEHGANNLVAGSYVFKTDPENYINKVNSLR